MSKPLTEYKKIINEAKKEAKKLTTIVSSETEVLKKIPDTFEEFCRLLKIRSGNKLVSFELYHYQKTLSDLIDNHYGCVVVKSRQLGLTQVIAAKFLYKAVKNPAYVALVLSKGQEDTSLIAHRVREMINSLKDYIELENDNLRTIRIKGGGTIHFKNSNPDASRGVDSVSDILFDECGFVSDMELIYTSAIPTLEMAGNDARIILLSTPCGVENWYYRQVTKNNEVDPIKVCEEIRSGAVEPVQYWTDTSGWCKFFVHWKAHPIYSQNPNYLDDIIKKKNLPEEKAKQEYDLSFTDSVSRIFNLNLVRSSFTLEKYDRFDDAIDKEASYYLGIDTAFQGDDYFVCVVLKKVWEKIEICYRYRKRGKPQTHYITEVCHLIDKYQPQRVTIETNAGGQGYLEQFQSAYPSLDIQGINTNGSSKPNMISRLLFLFEQGLLKGVKGDEFEKEFSAFERTENGKMSAPSGGHDDCVMATAIGCYGMPID